MEAHMNEQPGHFFVVKQGLNMQPMLPLNSCFDLQCTEIKRCHHDQLVPFYIFIGGT